MLQEFSGLLGLTANPSKSSLYCTGVSQLIKEQLMDCLQIKERKVASWILGGSIDLEEIDRRLL
jgi:hypothetical protein